MNETRTEPIKDANLPCTVQSIPSRENENVCDFIHLLDSGDFSNENRKDLDNFIPELESLLRNLEEKIVTVNSGNVSSVGSDLTKQNDEVLTDSDLNKLNTALSAFDDLKTLNNGLSIDSFAPQAEKKTTNNVISEVQPKLLLPGVKENKDNIFIMTESCQSGSTDDSIRWSETRSYLEDNMDRYATVCSENQNQELALTLLCAKSEHSGSTAVRPPLLNRSTSPAGDSETVITNYPAMHDGPGSVRGGITLQPIMKRNVRADEISNLKAANLVLQEKSCRQLSHTAILHSMTNSNKTAVENRTDVMTSEADMSGVTPYLMRATHDHTYFKVKDGHFISASQEESFELSTHDETSRSFSIVDNTVTGKNMGDIAIEVSVPGLTAYAMNEVLASSERSNVPEITFASEANIKTPLSSESLAAGTQKRAKDDLTASKAEQNKCTEIPALPPGSFFQQKGSKLCNNQLNKLIIKETNIDETCSSLKSRLSFAHIKREKFAGFTFEKPVVPQQIPGSSKTKRTSKSTKKHQRSNKALPSPTNHASPEPSTPSSSNTNSSNNVSKLESQCNIEGNKVEETNDLHYTYVKKELDLEFLNWI
jgi:hypothetical protein